MLYRNWKYEQELDSLLWKVDYKEIQLHENDRENSCQKQTRVSINVPLPRPIIKNLNPNVNNKDHKEHNKISFATIFGLSMECLENFQEFFFTKSCN